MGAGSVFIGLYMQGGLGGRPGGGHSNPGLAFSALEMFAPGTALKGRGHLSVGHGNGRDPGVERYKLVVNFYTYSHP